MANREPQFGMTEESVLGRRDVLLAGLGIGIGLIAGCASPAPAKSARLPGPLWPSDDLLAPKTAPAVAVAPLKPQTALMSNVIPRTSWTRGVPDKGDINPMLPVHWVTVHHDGMDSFGATDYASCASRLELIRMGHKGKGWADIGYHFVIDRSGRVWEGRELKYQGAHVKNNNEGNIGILCLGNFDLQKPSDAQMKSLERHLKAIMKQYKLSSANIRSHKEWPDAATACPGRNLQSKMAGVRRAVA